MNYIKNIIVIAAVAFAGLIAAPASAHHAVCSMETRAVNGVVSHWQVLEIANRTGDETSDLTFAVYHEGVIVPLTSEHAPIAYYVGGQWYCLRTSCTGWPFGGPLVHNANGTFTLPAVAPGARVKLSNQSASFWGPTRYLGYTDVDLCSSAAIDYDPATRTCTHRGKEFMVFKSDRNIVNGEEKVTSSKVASSNKF